MDPNALVVPLPITPGHTIAPAIRNALKNSAHSAIAAIDRLDSNAARLEYFHEVLAWCSRNIVAIEGSGKMGAAG